MRFVIQRVQRASVTVDNEVIGKIDRGYMVLIGVCDSDDEAVADKMVDKMIKLRINADLAVHALCQLQKGQQTFICRGGIAGQGQCALRVYNRPLQKERAGSRERLLWSAHGSRADQ